MTVTSFLLVKEFTVQVRALCIGEMLEMTLLIQEIILMVKTLKFSNIIQLCQDMDPTLLLILKKSMLEANIVLGSRL